MLIRELERATTTQDLLNNSFWKQASPYDKLLDYLEELKVPLLEETNTITSGTSKPKLVENVTEVEKQLRQLGLLPARATSPVQESNVTNASNEKLMPSSIQVDTNNDSMHPRKDLSANSYTPLKPLDINRTHGSDNVLSDATPMKKSKAITTEQKITRYQDPHTPASSKSRYKKQLHIESTPRTRQSTRLTQEEIVAKYSNPSTPASSKSRYKKLLELE